MLNRCKNDCSLRAIAFISGLCCLLTLFAPGRSEAQQEPVLASQGAPKAQAYFANAADYQNAGAFELAAEEWEKLLREFPNESQASVAWHHLGICSLQRKQPQLDRAVEAFRQALKDTTLPTREETLINLAWALYSQSRLEQADSNDTAADRTRRDLEEARQRLVEFLKDYADGAYADQAIFYLGDIENALGNRRRAIEYFKRFLENQRFQQSELRPEALYALAVAHEDEQQPPEAQRRYEEFLDQYAHHSLADEVRLRRAGLLAASDRVKEARELLELVRNSKSLELVDLAILRLAGLAARAGDSSQASQHYRELIDQFPDSPHAIPARIALGNIELQAGNLQQATEHFRTVYKLESPFMIEATHGLAASLMKQQDHAGAITVLNEAIPRLQKKIDIVASDANDRLNILHLAQADALYALDQRSSEAHQIYERIADTDSKSPIISRATYMAAVSALEIGQPRAAQLWAERFLSRFPDNPLRSEVAFVAGESLIQQGLHDGAVKALSRLVEADGDNDSAPLWRLRLSMAMYLSGKYESANSTARAALKQLHDPEEIAEAQFIAGASCLFLEQLPLAIDSLKSSYQASPQWANADESLLLLGEAYQRTENYSSARSAYTDLLSNHPQSRFRSQALYKLAQLAAIEKDWASAIDRYRTVVATPEASSFHDFSLYGVAWCLMQQKDFETAHRELQLLLRKDLTDAIGTEALLAEGICLRNLGRSEEAVNSLNAFLKRNPKGQNLANGLYELGLALTDLSRFSEANPVFSRILDEVPEYAAADKVIYELGWNAFEQDQISQAVDWFERLALEYPSSPLVADALYMVAQDHYDNERFAQAVDVYLKIRERAISSDLREKTLYKLGWSYFQLDQYASAADAFDQQVSAFPKGPLAIDGLFLRAECDFKREDYEEAFKGFQQARRALEQASQPDVVSTSVRTLIYLHGSQCLRELQRWNECEEWLKVILQKYPTSPYLPTVLYELGFCKQNQGDVKAAITYYSEVADQYRSEIAARARFMLGELYFSQKDYAKAIPEFQRVMYGFGGDQAPDEIKKWQAKSAYEAARCSELLLQSLSGAARKKGLETAIQFYQYVLEKDAAQELTAQAQSRLGEIQKLR